MLLRAPSPSTPSSHTTPSTAITTPSPSAQPKLLVPSGLRDVRIPNERIGPDLAAKLVMTTLESVLFLKSQVPMPVQQMQLLGQAGKNARAVKKRVELVQTLDVLSSHLHTTFVQLSAAYARSEASREPQDTERAHIMFTIGPPTSMTRERVLLELDGLDVMDWACAGEVSEDEQDMSEDADEEVTEDPEDDNPFLAYREDDPTSDSDSSRSPSRASSLSPSIPTRRSRRALPLRPPPCPTRLLALALINLPQSSSPPTHVHVLLRAPRRFSHVSWAPRQMLSKALETGCFGETGTTPSKARSKSSPERVTVISSRASPSSVRGASSTATTCEEDEKIWFEWTGKLTGFMEI